MSKKILLTTTSFQDTSGKHHDLLKSQDFEIIRARGPLNESEMLDLINQNGHFDAFLCGDDEITKKVIDLALPKLQVISKYGIGLDKIDVQYASQKQLPVLFTPGVNHTTVAEHVFGLMISLVKAFPLHINSVASGNWKRETGYELHSKKLGIFGLGRIGQEVALRAIAFGMDVCTYSVDLDESFCKEHKIEILSDVNQLFQISDIISLHAPLTPQTHQIINQESLSVMKDKAFIVNTARGGLVDEDAIYQACKSGKLGGYGTDVLEIEPVESNHQFLELDNIIITPHIGSRTYESVERQAVRSTKNLINYLDGKSDFIQANKF